MSELYLFMVIPIKFCGKHWLRPCPGLINSRMSDFSNKWSCYVFFHTVLSLIVQGGTQHNPKEQKAKIDYWTALSNLNFWGFQHFWVYFHFAVFLNLRILSCLCKWFRIAAVLSEEKKLWYYLQRDIQEKWKHPSTLWKRRWENLRKWLKKSAPFRS